MFQRFQARIVALMILVVLLAQLATFGVVTVATERAVGSRLQQELRVGQRVWEQFHDNRAEQLLASGSVLADDFGFRAAAATGDAPTIASALGNHGARMGADLAWLLTPQGKWVAGTEGIGMPPREMLAALVAEAQAAGFAMQVLSVQDRLLQVALLPVMAPDLVGWLAVGQAFEDRAAADYRNLTGLDASFVSGSAGAWQVHATSLPRTERNALALTTLPVDASGESLRLDDARYLAVARPLEGGTQGQQVVLQGSFDAALAPYMALRTRILAMSALAALLALVVAATLGRGISRPLARLADAARRIQAGDYSRPPQPEGRGEIADLAGAFGRMQADIAAREARILHQARHDGLTGLPNRGHARDLLQAAIQAGDAAGTSSAVVAIDLDRFKEINDTLGHDFADEVLQEVGRRLRATLAPQHVVARLGGDEFLAVLVGVDAESAMAEASSLLSRLRHPLELSRTRISLDASLGVAMHPAHGADADTLLRRADIALYDAKAAHSGTALYAPGRDEVHLRQLTLMSDLRKSIERGQLTLRFQPKLQVADAHVVHVEALLRWRHATLGMVPPDEFIPLAERSGFIHELTRYVLDESLRCNARWRREGVDLGLAVNLSAMDLMDADLPDFILDRLRRHGVPAGKLILEVTEGALMRDIDYAIRMLLRLKACGIRLAIDDFGTGYSSLAQLKRMPVDELKIDKSFVMQLAEGSDDAVIVRSTIELGHNMGLSVIAEGVENEAAMTLLRSYRCDMVQGYLFSAPLDADALLSWCRRHAGEGQRIHVATTEVDA
ncbi:EAL domain-containing protein [Luteimonas aestuarii]|uniref:EAL domain-containing protein n=2 Tax=Luteimonas aestuarii TaxID=453837 RepID=A0A4R5U3Z4_9GAMM|nr:EAL domain-containing protein [Luteimonas aestuarii]TDK28442.1 EAL domain-containing protein [Luteimonas aestuarii]